MAQAEPLQVLGEHSPVRISDLAARRRLAPSTVSGLIGQVITARLVARDVDAADRGASVVTLTDAGREKPAAWTVAHERRVDAALAALDEVSRAPARNRGGAVAQKAKPARPGRVAVYRPRPARTRRLLRARRMLLTWRSVKSRGSPGARPC